MSSWPTISIVTCSYQQRRTLERTMRSALEQDYPALEYIVVDGGSTDGSRAVIERHAARLAWWVSEPDRGQTHALVKGFARARGEVLGWLCSDDLLLPGALKRVGEFFGAHPGVLAAYGDALWIDAEGRFLRPKKEMEFSRFVFLFDHNYVPQPSMFWRRSLYDAVRGLDPRFDLSMDADLWERFSAVTRIARIPAYLSCMRHYDGQKVRARRADALAEDRAIRLRGAPRWAPRAAGGSLRLAARCLRVAAKALSGGYGARVPAEHLSWLERMAVPEALR